MTGEYLEMGNRNGIIQSTVAVTAITFIIKLLGLIKQAVIAAYCGATIETDAFFIATGILTQLCVVIFSAISISLLTIHTNVLVKEGREKSNDLINGVLRVFLPLSLLLSIAFFFGAPIAAKIFAPSYTGKELSVLIHYIRIMSCAFVLWCYYLIINVVLETDKKFLPGRGQAFFQNVFLIVGAVFLYKKYGMPILVYGFLLSGLAECILVTWCARKQFKLVFHKIHASKETNELIKLALPLIIGSAIYEINDIVDKQISTGLGAGNVSYLTYGGTINEIVTGVVVVSVSTVLFSHFATWIAEGKSEEVGISLRRVIEYLTLIILPIMVMCVIAGDQVVEILYGRGNFDSTDVWLTYGVVIGYALGFVFQAARANIVKVYYAFQDTRRPMINGALSVSINIVLSILLSKIIGVAGIAVATSIAMLIVTGLLLKDIKRYLPTFSIRKSIKECGKGLLAAIVSGSVLLGLRKILPENRYISFIIQGFALVVIYLLMLLLIKSHCINNVKDIVIKKLKHGKGIDKVSSMINKMTDRQG